MNLLNSNGNSTATSEIYEKYCSMIGKEKALSYRRVVDLLVELVNTGLLSSRTISRGRNGYGTEYTLLMPLDLVGPAVEESWWQKQLESKITRDLAKEIQKEYSSRKGGMFGTSRLFSKYRNLSKY